MNWSKRIAKLPTAKFDSAVLFLLLGVSACSLCLSSTAKILAQQPFAPSQSYLGFDLNTYPGDAALSVLRKTFSFGGYWLNAPPGTKQKHLAWQAPTHALGKIRVPDSFQRPAEW